MVDDKDNDANDPWAGIDAGDASEPQADFAFSFDEGTDAAEAPAESPFAGVFDTPAEPAEEVADAGEIAGVFEEAVEESLPEVTGVNEEELPFSSDLSASEDEGAALGNLDAADDAAMVDEWLAEEPAGEAVAEAPLAVFSGEDLHEHEPQQEQDQETAESAVLSSAIQIGTGNSGVMSPSDVISLDEWADAGAKSLVDMPDLGDEASAAAETPPEMPAFAIAEDDAADFGDEGFGDEGFGMDEAAAAVGGGLVAAGVEALGEAAAPAPVAGKKKPKATKPGKSSGGGIGQMIGIVLGGLMALPITYAILVWGFQKDPFKFTKMVPQEVAFLLPEKFQPGYKKPSAAGLPKLDQAASLDSLPAAAEGVEAPATAEVEPTGDDAAAVVADAGGEPAAPAAPAEPAEPAAPAAPAAAPADDLFTEEQPAAKEPAAPVVPEPAPLDFSGLESAIAKVDASFDELAAVADPEDPARKKLLVGWYKNLAAVAEQMVLLETAAADSSRPLEKTPGQLESVIAKITGNDTVVGDLGRLGGMWLSSKKRPVDGAVLVATFNGTRQVGPYWSSSITVAGKEPKTVAIISRREPAVSAGEQVLVTGVVFDGDVLWATDCRQLEKAAAAEDLF
jgi:hypothetical protein